MITMVITGQDPGNPWRCSGSSTIMSASYDKMKGSVVEQKIHANEQFDVIEEDYCHFDDTLALNPSSSCGNMANIGEFIQNHVNRTYSENGNQSGNMATNQPTDHYGIQIIEHERFEMVMLEEHQTFCRQFLCPTQLVSSSSSACLYQTHISNNSLESVSVSVSVNGLRLMKKSSMFESQEMQYHVLYTIDRYSFSVWKSHRDIFTLQSNILRSLFFNDINSETIDTASKAKEAQSCRLLSASQWKHSKHWMRLLMKFITPSLDNYDSAESEVESMSNILCDIFYESQDFQPLLEWLSIRSCDDISTSLETKICDGEIRSKCGLLHQEKQYNVSQLSDLECCLNMSGETSNRKNIKSLIRIQAMPLYLLWYVLFFFMIVIMIFLYQYLTLNQVRFVSLHIE